MKQIAKEELLLDGESYRNFVCSLKSPFTKASYTKALRQFMSFRKISTCSDLTKGDPKFLQTSGLIEKKTNLVISFHCLLEQSEAHKNTTKNSFEIAQGLFVFFIVNKGS